MSENKIGQSKKHSHYEIITNQITGIALGWIIVYFIFPFIGLTPNVSQATASSAIFFVVSYSRTYLIRRIFNKIGKK